MHLRWDESNVIGTNAIVGGGVPLANGAAWSRQRQGKGDVVFTFLGDGVRATSAISSSHLILRHSTTCPSAFYREQSVCGFYDPGRRGSRDAHVVPRYRFWGFRSFRVDGMDAAAVRAATAEA